MSHAGEDKPATSGSLTSVLTSKIHAMPVAARLLLSMATLVCVAMLDTVTGNEISFSIFYLLPVSFAGAFISRGAGFGLAVASAFSCSSMNSSTTCGRRTQESEPWLVKTR